MNSGELALADYLGVIRRRWVQIVVVTVSLLLVATLWSITRVPIYSATTYVIVSAQASNQSLDPTASGVRDVARQLENELLYARSTVVLGALSEGLGYRPTVTVAGQSNKADQLEFTATGDDPVLVAEASERYAATFIAMRTDRIVDASTRTRDAVLDKLTALKREYAALGPDDASSAGRRNALEQQVALYEQYINGLDLVGELAGASSAQVVSPAEVPTRPVSPQPIRAAVLAALVGVCLGTGIALVREFVDDRVKSKEALEALSGGVTTLAIIPALGRRSSELVNALEAPRLSEAFRNLRTALQFVSLRKPIHSVQVTSAEASVGKSTCAVHLAVAVAQGGRRVVLIDADLRKPTVASRFGLDGTTGLTTVMLGEASLDEAMQSVAGCPSLSVVTAGLAPANAADLLWPTDSAGVLAQTTLPGIVRALVEKEYFVVVDSPPVLPVADALTISRAVDATVLVVSATTSTRRGVSRAMEMLAHADARLVGTVLNQAASVQGGYGYGYGRPGVVPKSVAQPAASDADPQPVSGVPSSPRPSADRNPAEPARVRPPVPSSGADRKAGSARAVANGEAPTKPRRAKRSSASPAARPEGPQDASSDQLVSMLRAHLSVEETGADIGQSVDDGKRVT